MKKGVKALAIKKLYCKKPILCGFVFAVAALVFLYLYFLITAALYTAETSRIRAEADLVRKDLASLESQYMKLSSTIDIDLAREMGFVEDLKKTIFVSKRNQLTAQLER